jgi:hypothetical protein
MIIYQLWHHDSLYDSELIGLYSTKVKAEKAMRKWISIHHDFKDIDERLTLMSHERASYRYYYSFDFDSTHGYTDNYNIIGVELDKE